MTRSRRTISRGTRGEVDGPSQRVVEYHYGPGDHESSEEICTIDVIVDHCGPDPAPGSGDQTQTTVGADEIGEWAGREGF